MHVAYSNSGQTYVTKARVIVATSLDRKHLCTRLALHDVRTTVLIINNNNNTTTYKAP